MSSGMLHSMEKPCDVVEPSMRVTSCGVLGKLAAPLCTKRMLLQSALGPISFTARAAKAYVSSGCRSVSVCSTPEPAKQGNRTRAPQHAPPTGAG